MDLVIRNGLHYEKFTDELFTGKVVGFEKGYIKAGKIEGEWREYWRNGQVFKECFFINGLLNILTKFGTIKLNRIFTSFFLSVKGSNA